VFERETREDERTPDGRTNERESQPPACRKKKNDHHPKLQNSGTKKTWMGAFHRLLAFFFSQERSLLRFLGTSLL